MVMDLRKPDPDTLTVNSDGYFFFPFRNTGDRPLVLSHMASGDSTVSCQLPDTVPPGMSNMILLHYDTRVPGKFKKKIVIRTNAPGQRRVRLQLEGVVANPIPETRPINPEDPQITFTSTVVSKDTIPFGGNGTFVFTFKNTGKSPLLISHCSATCSCLVPTYPREEIPRGATGTVWIRYDSRRVGPIHKSVTVFSNDPDNPEVLLYIKGYVKNEDDQ